MRPVIAALVIAAQLGLVSGAMAGEAQKAEAKPKEKRICRSIKTTGSRLATQVCHTRSEWEGIDRQTQFEADRTMDGVKSRESIGSGSGINNY